MLKKSILTTSDQNAKKGLFWGGLKIGFWLWGSGGVETSTKIKNKLHHGHFRGS